MPPLVRAAPGAVRQGRQQPRPQRRPRRPARARARARRARCRSPRRELSMNRSITPHRKVAFASVPLADIKEAKNALGCHRQRHRARHRHRRAAQLPARPRRAARSIAGCRHSDQRPRRRRARARQPRVDDVRVAARRDRAIRSTRIEAIATVDGGLEAGPRGRRGLDARGVGRRRRRRRCSHARFGSTDGCASASACGRRST